jgi:hypothetical protein
MLRQGFILPCFARQFCLCLMCPLHPRIICVF